MSDDEQHIAFARMVGEQTATFYLGALSRGVEPLIALELTGRWIATEAQLRMLHAQQKDPLFKLFQ